MLPNRFAVAGRLLRRGGTTLGQRNAVPVRRQRPQWQMLGLSHVKYQSTSTNDRLRQAFQKEGGISQLQAATPVTINDTRYLQLSFDRLAEKTAAVETLWLRDSCQSAHSVTDSSGQKRFRSADLPDNPEVEWARVSSDGKTLEVAWKGETTDEGKPHVSTFAVDELVRRLGHVAYPAYPPLPGRRMWDRARIERELKPVAFDEWAAHGPDFWRGLYDLYQTGLLIVDGVPETDQGVTQTANAIGNVQTTFYGETFDVVSKPQAENVAYTNVFLCLHQDLMYMIEPPYIQLLHCLRNECDGGESLFSDSVRAAYQMAIEHPEEAELLARYPVRYHYERHGYYYFNEWPVFDVRDGGLIYKTAWSPPFQDMRWKELAAATAGGPPKGTTEFQAWRRAAKRFSDLIESPENQYEVKMKPGQCVLFNNMRALHGRQMFNTSHGSRHLKGTYIAEQTFTSKVRAMVREGHYAPAAPKGWPRTPAEIVAEERQQIVDMLAKKA